MTLEEMAIKISVYCREKEDCEKCVFYNGYGCMLGKCGPHEWEVDEQIEKAKNATKVLKEYCKKHCHPCDENCIFYNKDKKHTTCCRLIQTHPVTWDIPED